MPKETKANKATSEARLSKVYEYLVSGMNRLQMWQYVTNEKSKDYPLFKDIQQRQLDRYIADANTLIAQEAAFQRPRELGLAIARMNAVFYAAMRIPDYQRAIGAARELHKLLGLYAPVQSELKLTADSQVALTQLLNELESQNADPATLFNSIFAKLAAQKVNNA